MIIAKEKKKTNIAEYIIYMWQIEDLIRACKFDINEIDNKIISRYDVSLEQKKEIRNWYYGLIDLMLEENIKQAGHLQFVKNTIADLNRLHLLLLNSPDENKYKMLFAQTSPTINEFKAKSGDLNQDSSDIETCFSGIYALVLLRLQKAKITASTEEAIASFTKLIAQLAAKFHKEEQGDLET